MLLIKNGHIKTMAGDDIPNGQILIEKGKIVAIGTDFATKHVDECIDAEGRLVTPGCIDGHCHVGITNEKRDHAGNDHNETSDPIVPHMRGLDAFNPQEETVKRALTGGVTTVCTGPGSAEIVGGTFIAVKTAGTRVDDMVLNSALAMKCAFGENAKRFFGDKGKAPVTRMAIAAMLREVLFKTKEYLKEKETGKNPKFDMKLEAMIPVVQGEMPLKAHAHRADDIFTAIRIAKEFGLKLTLDHCTDGALIAKELAKEGYPAFVGPSYGAKNKAELEHKNFATATALHDVGLLFAIVTDAPVLPIEDLCMFAGLAVAAGLDEENAWRAITINPALINGISDRVGSLEVGKDADIVIWNADPLTTIGGKAHTTIVDGKIVYQRV